MVNRDYTQVGLLKALKVMRGGLTSGGYSMEADAWSFFFLFFLVSSYAYCLS